jgi:hypothetical protein
MRLLRASGGHPGHQSNHLSTLIAIFRTLSLILVCRCVSELDWVGWRNHLPVHDNDSNSKRRGGAAAKSP